MQIFSSLYKKTLFLQISYPLVFAFDRDTLHRDVLATILHFIWILFYGGFLLIYDTFAPFYDQAMNDYSWCEHFLHTMIESKLTNRTSVLELGCGTGRILQLVSRYFTHSAGIDINPSMMEYAKKRLPTSKFYHQDMRSFNLSASYDLILCLFDSINHLTSFDYWQQTFSRIKEHLAPGGVCIFDMNTPQKLSRLALLPPFVHPFGNDDMMIMDVVEDKTYADESGLFHFETTLFEHLEDDLYKRHIERIIEYAPTAELVFSTVSSQCSSVEMYDEDERKIGPSLPLSEVHDGRIFFLCRY